MEIIFSTAFGLKVETQTVENDPVTELAKKAMAPHPLLGLVCEDFIYFSCLFYEHVNVLLRKYSIILTEEICLLGLT